MKTHENYEQLLKLFTYTYTHTDIYIYIHTYTNFIDISWFYDVHRCSHCLPRARWEPRSVADSDFFRSRYGAPGADGLTQRMIGEVFRKAWVVGCRSADPVLERWLRWDWVVPGSWCGDLYHNCHSNPVGSGMAVEQPEDKVTISGSMQGCPEIGGPSCFMMPSWTDAVTAQDGALQQLFGWFVASHRLAGWST